MQLQAASKLSTGDSPEKLVMGRVAELLRDVIDRHSNYSSRTSSSNATGSLDLVEAWSLVQHEAWYRRKIRVSDCRRGPSAFVGTGGPAMRSTALSAKRSSTRFRHSEAKTVELRVEFGARRMCVRVGDDGLGIDAKVVQSGRDGHFGLSGMRDRRSELEGGSRKEPHRGRHGGRTVSSDSAHLRAQRARSCAKTVRASIPRMSRARSGEARKQVWQ
jgi:hypothetical protein